MGAVAKKIVKGFYTSDYYLNPDSLAHYVHPEAELNWNSSSGLHTMKYPDILNMTKEISKSFNSLRAEITQLFSENDLVAIHFTYFVKTVENPEEELPMAHFMAIWEVRDGKLFKGDQFSQPAQDSPDNVGTFL